MGLVFDVLWVFILPIFVFYVATSAYCDQRRRGDIAAAKDVLADMREITNFAVSKAYGNNIDRERTRNIVLSLISRIGLEMLHRPQNVQEWMQNILSTFLANAEVAMGFREDKVDEILKRLNDAEMEIRAMLQGATVFEIFRQGWSNPGINVSLDPLLQKFSKPYRSN